METGAASDNSRWQAGLLSAVAGFADTVGFLTFHAFAGLMTGNTVFLGIAAAEGRWAEALRSAAIIAAFLAGIGAAVASRRFGMRLATLLGFEAAMIAVAAFSPFVFAAPALAFAMGVQNAAATRFGGTTLNTVFLTGDLQKLVGWLVGGIGGRGADAQAGAGSRVLAVVYAGYLAGALLGATLHALSRRALLFSLILLASALVVDRASGRRK